MIEGAERIRDIFSIFHDGSIDRYSIDGDTLSLDVDIEYLAERVNPSYRTFHVRLVGVSGLRFSTWPNDRTSEPVVITDAREIFEPELEILEGRLQGGEVEVICNQHSPRYPYCGGELLFDCTAAEVIDEGGKTYSLDELLTLSRGYWEEWARGNQV